MVDRSVCFFPKSPASTAELNTMYLPPTSTAVARESDVKMEEKSVARPRHFFQSEESRASY